jgi:LuxR family maltose regulon positive regulatory protein
MATWLGTDHADWRGELAVAQGWLGLARRLLKGLEPGAEHGWLFVHEAEKYLLANDTVRARELGTRAAGLGGLPMEVVDVR